MSAVPSPSPADPPTLEFVSVDYALTWPYETSLEKVSFAIRPGELVLITLAAGHVRSPYADLAQSLARPHGGEVRFGGEPCAKMTPKALARTRFQTGRVFDDGGWVSNLSIVQNVLLAQRHHATASQAELREKADTLMRGFGLPGLPSSRPASASHFQLRLAQWTRALLGDPKLLILERPTKDVRPEAVPPFLAAIDSARQRGSAVLWITTDGVDPNTPDNVAPANITSRFSVRGALLTAGDDEDD